MKLSYDSIVALVVGLVILALVHVGESGVSGLKGPPQNSSLQVGFYNGRCPNKTLDIQAFIEAEVENEFRIVPTLLAALLRLQFHDCFVNGCDASILINGTTAEMAADANIGVRGFKFIDSVKAKVEEKCPGIVSCADIIAIATKVVLKLGGGPDCAVQTGRRDGTKSRMQDVNLPGSSLTIAESFVFFKARGFNLTEMVTLLGCHSVGIAHCRFFVDRLYNDNSGFDPNMDQILREKLKQICPRNMPSNNEAFLDQGEAYAQADMIDTSFYNQTVHQRALLGIDQALARDPSTNTPVNEFISSPNTFNEKLKLVMVKLQAVQVLTGNQGNIRKECSKFN